MIRWFEESVMIGRKRQGVPLSPVSFACMYALTGRRGECDLPHERVRLSRIGENVH